MRTWKNPICFQVQAVLRQILMPEALDEFRVRCVVLLHVTGWMWSNYELGSTQCSVQYADWPTSYITDSKEVRNPASRMNF